jgi:hypothetical protein
MNLGGDVDVVGEMAFQEALEGLAQGCAAFGTRVRLVTATLHAEPDNPHDERAIRVDVEAMPVGYVAREETQYFHAVLERLRERGEVPSCRAELVGGWDCGNGDTGYIGVRLHSGRRPARWNGRLAFLPESPWRECLPIRFAATDVEAVPRRGKVVATLADAGGGSLAVTLDEAWIGHVLERPDLASWVATLEAEGLPCTAYLRIHNGTPVISVSNPDAIGAALYALGAFDPRASPLPRRSSRWLCRRCHLVWYMRLAGRPEHDECPDCGSFQISAY